MDIENGSPSPNFTFGIPEINLSALPQFTPSPEITFTIGQGPDTVILFTLSFYFYPILNVM